MQGSSFSFPMPCALQPLSLLTRCIRLALGIAVGGAVFISPVFAEGTKQWSPRESDYSALGVTETNGGSPYPFAGYDQPAERRLHIRIADPAKEIVYIGLGNMTGNAGDAKTANYYWRIKAPDGTVVHGAHMAGGTSSNLDTHAKAIAGPNTLNPAGYATNGAWTFDPAAAGKGAGDYYIEFDINNDAASAGTFTDTYNGVTYTNPNALNINWFDITVATKGASPQAIDGRVWSKSWGVRTNDPALFSQTNPFRTPFNGSMYAYDANNFVTKVDFFNSGLRPLQGQFSFNATGTGNSGDKVNDRKSVANANSTNPQHKIFLNPPDNVVYPLGQEGTLQNLPLSINNINDTTIKVEVTQPGRVEILLDINKDGVFSPNTDRRLFADVVAGVNQVPWDGKNGAGVKVPKSGFPIDVKIAYTQGETHFTAYDVEGLDNGFKVYTQTDQGTTGPNLLFWDDSAISASSGVTPEIKVNTDAGDVTRQRWTNIPYGDLNTLNTWWYAYRDYRSTVLYGGNVAPVAADDSATTAEDTALNGTTLLVNDTDADGDTLTVNTTPVTPPSNGTLTLRADGTYTYMPNLNYHGTDSFVYAISDGNGGTASATVTITITPVNDPPVAQADTATTSEDTPVDGSTVLANDSDVEGDTLSVDTAPVTPPTNGSVVLRADGTYTYTPKLNFNGTDSFTYRVSDGKGGTATTTVTITVTPVNDPPVANDDTVTTLEDTALNSSVLGNDSDIDGDTLAVNTTPVTAPTNGTLVLRADGTYTYTPKPNFHGTDSFVYEMTDGNGKTASATVTITITSVNDPPVAVADAATLAEDTVLNGTTLLSNDSDVDGDTLSVTTTPVTPPAHGAVVLKTDGTYTYTPDKDYFGTDSFVYEVTDGKGGKANATVTLTITPVNDPPAITSTNNVTFAENGTGTALDVQSTDDHDAENSGVTYTLLPAFDGSLFAINPATGAITFKTPPDYEKPQDANKDNAYILMVKSCDSEGLCTEQVIVIVVTNVVETNPPKIINTIAGTPENQTFVTTVGATDPDPNDQLTFSIIGGVDALLFTIDSVTGELRFKNPPDFENPLDADRNNEYDVVVQVYDNTEPDHVDNQALRVVVTNVNEAPVLTLGGGEPQALSQAENSTAVTTVAAQDVDAGDVLTYRISGGTDAALFEINPSTGVLTFKTAPDFENPNDSDKNNTYQVEITVQDRAQLSDSQLFTITINDANDAPMITSEGGAVTANLSVVENTTTTVTTVTSTDQDKDTPVYAISGGADATRFVIDPVSGTLRFASAPDFETPLDANQDNVYEVTVTVSDGRGGVDSQQLSIRVTDTNEAPRITSNGGGDAAAVVLPENTLDTTTVSATDADVGDTLSYSISGGEDAALFSIDPANGKLVFITAPDFEKPQDADKNNQYRVEVTVTDKQGSTDTQMLTVTITDANDAPAITSNGSEATANVSVAENTTAVTTLTSSDQDNDTPTYSISGGADAALFSLDPVSGKLQFKTAPDFEDPTDADKNNAYELVVTVVDGKGGLDTQALTIRVTDANDAPVITSDGGGASASFTVDENATTVTSVTSRDQDNDTPSYRISGGVDAALFQIDPVSGVLRFSVAPDYEKPQDSNKDNRYEVVVQVDDGKGGTDEQTLTINVRNVNDPPVIISNGGGEIATLTAAENQVGVTLVQATDDDGDKLTFSISGGDDAALFAINNVTGSLVFIKAPDFEKPSDSNADGIYQVEVKVVDGKGGQDTQLLRITLEDVNESPVITSHGGGVTATLNVPEGQTAVTTLSATDPDKGDVLNYTITGGVDFGLFSIDAATGALAFKTAPDYEQPSDADKNNQYVVEVTVRDSQGRFDVQTLTVNVQDVNDHIVLNVRVFLQGAYVSSTGMMTDNLRRQGLIPVTQPYAPAPLRYSGSETLNPTLATVEGKDAIVDWMLVDLRDALQPSKILATRAAMLQRDGDLVDAQTGSPNLAFRDMQAGDYFVSVRHRNHLGVMSAAKIRLTDAATLVDFTAKATATYGSFARLEAGQIALLWAGDANQDQKLIGNGPYNDTNLVLGNVLTDKQNNQANSNYRLLGYLSSDLNMDGVSLFSGPGNDINILLGNVLLHPNNTSFAANFVINGGLPK